MSAGRAAAHAANHVLKEAPLALERLRRHAGRTVAFACGPLQAALTVQTTGEVTAALPDAAHDLEVRLSPFLLPRLAAREEAAFREIAMDGDMELAQEISFLLRNLRWDVEGDLARVVGGLAAHRLVAMGRSVFAGARDAAWRGAQGAAEYATEEASLVASRVKVAGFMQAVARLRDDVERLEKRIAALER